MGLTGQIASGKSTVASCFGDLGIPTISADQEAKNITTQGQPAFFEIIRHFGDTILTPENELNRRALRQLIFSNTKERLWLEKLLHPLIRLQIQTLIQSVSSPYCLIEIPLLIDKIHYPYLNRILLVQAESSQQISRIMLRDNCTEKQAENILATQTDNKTRSTFADDILVNTGLVEEMKSKIALLHRIYLQESS